MSYVNRIRKVVFVFMLVVLAGCPVFGVGPDHPSGLAAKYSYMIAADGVLLGDAYKVDGGAISAVVGVKKPLGGTMMHPDLTPMRRDEYSSLVVQYTAIYPALAEWMNNTWDGKKSKNLRIACFSPDGTLVWDRSYGLVEIQEVIIQECVFGSMSTPAGTVSTVTQPGFFAVKFQCWSIVDSTGPFPTSSGYVPDRISIRDTLPKFALDGPIAFTTAAVEPISITKHAPLGRGPGVVDDDIPRTKISSIAVSVPFAYADGLLSWAKTWLPATSVDGMGNRNVIAEKNGTMTWTNDTGDTTCTINLKNVGVSGYEYISDRETNPLVKVSLYCEDLKFLLPGASTPGIPGAPAAPATVEPAPTTEVAPKVATLKKGAALRSSGADLGTPRKFGPFELVVKSAEYQTKPLMVAGNDLSPAEDQKLFVVTYTLRNPSVEVQKVDSGTVGFEAFDVSGATYGDFKIGIGARMVGISGSTLIQDDTLTFSAAIIIPAVESIAKMRVTCPIDSSMVEYKFAAGE